MTKEKNRFEYAIMQKIYGQSPYQASYQGIMLASSSGKLFEHFVGFDADDALVALKGAKRSYDRMKKEERVLQRALRPEDQMPRWEPSRQDVIDIRITKRSMPDDRFPTTDQRHSMYFHFDYLWLKKSELADFVPKDRAPGSERRLAKKYVTRFGLTNILMPEAQAWQVEHLRGGDLRTVVTAVKPDGIHLRLEGEFHLDGKDEVNDSSYKGRLLGTLVVAPDLMSLVSFEAVALGDVNVRRRNPGMHPGPGDTVAGALFQINGTAPNDKMTPSGWVLGYRDF